VLGSFRAVKVMWRGNFENEDDYFREFKGIQNYEPISRQHPGLVNILQVGRNDVAGHYYYVMELGDDQETGDQIDPVRYVARTLSSDLRRRHRLPVAECVTLGVALAEALHFLHEGRLVHRDLKPANIIYVKNRPKLADIGLVTGVDPHRTRPSIVGTQGYMPPEGPGHAAGDIYSLGVVLYQVSTGLSASEFPMFPSSLAGRGLAPELTALNQVILKACAESPHRRYRSADDLRRDLVSLRETHFG
jgi:serine/threonine protein kinase